MAHGIPERVTHSHLQTRMLHTQQNVLNERRTETLIWTVIVDAPLWTATWFQRTSCTLMNSILVSKNFCYLDSYGDNDIHKTWCKASKTGSATKSMLLAQCCERHTSEYILAENRWGTQKTVWTYTHLTFLDMLLHSSTNAEGIMPSLESLFQIQC